MPGRRGGVVCPTCGCCTIGRMGTCVGGCGPRGGRSKHDQACRAECQNASKRPLEASGSPQPPEHGHPVLIAMSERQFQKHVVDALTARGWSVFVVPDMRKTLAGLPDLLCIHDGVPLLLAWELKAEQTRVTEKQKTVILTMGRIPGVDARVIRPSMWTEMRDTLFSGKLLALHQQAQARIGDALLAGRREGV